MTVEGETAYCIDINTDFKNGYKTRADASSRMSADQISRRGVIYRVCETVRRQLTAELSYHALPVETAV